MVLVNISCLSHVLFSIHFIFSLSSPCHVSYTWGGIKDSEEVLYSPFLLLSLIFTLTHQPCMCGASDLELDCRVSSVVTLTLEYRISLCFETSCHFSLMRLIHCFNLKCAKKEKLCGCWLLPGETVFLGFKRLQFGKELLENLVNHFVTQRHWRLASTSDCLA